MRGGFFAKWEKKIAIERLLVNGYGSYVDLVVQPKKAFKLAKNFDYFLRDYVTGNDTGI